jgi:uncharacterized protein
MSEVIVTVRGEHERRVAPEFAVVQLVARADGPERGPVVERATQLAAPLHDDLVASQRSGEVVEFSSGRVAVWSERPWNSDGRQLPPVHHASIEVSATFRDFGALSWWIGEVADTEGVEVAGVQWTLSPETRARVEQEVATEAVEVAVERARAYASALGLDTLAAREIADLGLLGTHPEPAPGAPKMMRAMAADAGGAALTLQPADILVTAAVDARFVAS